MMEIGRVYVARNGLKAFIYWKAFFGDQWWARDERGCGWAVTSDGKVDPEVLPPGSKGEHPLDLVEPTNVMVRIPEKHLKWRAAPELREKGRPA